MKNRRSAEGYKLRVHIDALRDAQATTDEQWLEKWIYGGGQDVFIPRSSWISYLEKCIAKEAEIYFRKEAA